MTKSALFLVILFISAPAFADEAQDAYCKYVAQQAMAQRDILRSPLIVAGPQQPSTGTPPQVIAGLTNNLSNDRKASLTVQAARTTCALYIVAADAQQRIFFALPSIERDILQHRSDLIQRASNQLDAMVAKNMKLVEAQNLTKPALYSLQEAKMRLDTSRTTTLTGIASPYVPALSTTPLRDLIGAKLLAEAENQKAINKLAEQDSWDFDISVGGHKEIGSSNLGKSGAYGGFSFTYNLGRRAAAQHYDKSANAYVHWKETQFDDVAAQAIILKQQMAETIKIQGQQLIILRNHDADITAQLHDLEGIDTDVALAFRNQLLADQAILQVDLSDVGYRIQRLQEYIAANF